VTKQGKHQCLKNLSAVLKAAGSSLEKCVEVNVFLADMDDFAKMNEVYKEYFGDVKPARTLVSPCSLSFLYYADRHQMCRSEDLALEHRRGDQMYRSAVIKDTLSTGSASVIDLSRSRW